MMNNSVAIKCKIPKAGIGCDLIQSLVTIYLQKMMKSMEKNQDYGTQPPYDILEG